MKQLFKLKKLTKLIRGNLTAGTRTIATLKASEGGYIKLPQPIEIGADDDFEFEMVVQVERDDANYDSVLESAEKAPVAFFVRKNPLATHAWEHGSYQCRMQSTSGAKNIYTKEAFKTADYPTIFRKLKVVRAGNVFSFYCDGEFQDSGTIPSGTESWLPFTITRINELATCRFLEFKVTKNGQQIIDYDLNAKHGTTIIPNLAQPLGTPEVESTNVTFDEPNAWRSILVSTGLTIGKSYVLEIDIDMVGQVQFINYKVAPPRVGASGKYMFLVEPTAATTYVQTSQASTGVINSFKLTPNPQWAEYINVTDDNKKQYTWDAQRNAWISGDRPYITFNGVDQLAEYPGKLIDVDNLAGTTIEGYFEPSAGTLYSQNTSAEAASREFQLYDFNGGITLAVGGRHVGIANTPVNAGVYKFVFTSNTQVQFYHNDNLIADKAFPIGAAREADAIFRINARGGGNTTTYGWFKSGLSYNHKINGGAVYNFPMDDIPSTNPVMRNIGSGANGTYIGLNAGAYNVLEVAQ